jgi:hypothetical protein
VPGGYYIEIAITGFSNFFIERVNGALPLQWLDVKAQWVNHDAKITWQVAQEINVKDYTVQQSLDGINFTDACNVKANNATTYSCTVSADANTIHYYRVLQTDIDGKSSISKIVVLNSTGTQGVSIYPNPVTDKMQVTGLQNFNEFTIINIEGKIMKKQKLTARPQSISVQYLQPGMYLLKLIGNSQTQTLKFLKK